MTDVNHPPLTSGNTFIVRIWLEWSKDGPCWRGQIVHAQSGEKMAFLSLESMLAFIRSYVKMSSAGEGETRKSA